MAETWSYSLEFRGEKHDLEERQLAVGRSRTCDVSVKDPSVSRRHAELTAGGGKILVRDLGSSNGTFINGQRVAETGELFHGDILGLGDADLDVQVVSNVIEIPGLPASEPEADRAPGQMGEATSVLQAESMRLAQEALDEAAPPAETPVPAPPPAAAPGAHMAPLAPTPEPSPPEPPPPVIEPSAPASPMATIQIPTTGGEPAAGEIQSPLETMALPSFGAAELPGGSPPEETPAEETPLSPTPPAENPMMTQVIPEIGAPGFAGELPGEVPPVDVPPELSAPPSPMMTQAIPSLAGEPPGEIEFSEEDLAALDLPELEPEPETEKVGLVDPEGQPLTDDAPEPELPVVEAPSAEPPPELFQVEAPPMAASPPAATPAATPPDAEPGAIPPPVEPSPVPPESRTPVGPVKDIREATLGTPAAGGEGAAGAEPLPPPSGGKGEILPSLDGFDTTLGPGVQVPESMQRAQENLAKVREAQKEAGEPLGSLYQQPVQLPPVAGFGVRALAALFDGAWLGLLEYAGWRYLGLSGLALACAVGLLVILAGWSIWGSSPGKRLLRLYVCNKDGQAGLGVPRAALRLVGYALSGLLLGVGFLMVLSSSRRGLHDRLAGTWVRRYT